MESRGLATSESRKACVIKFQATAPNKRGAAAPAAPAAGGGATITDHHHHYFDEEAARWKVTLVGKSTLIVPYAKTCEGMVN